MSKWRGSYQPAPKEPELEPFKELMLFSTHELEYYEERAAIMEFDGGCRPHVAEGMAFTETLLKFWSPQRERANGQESRREARRNVSR